MIRMRFFQELSEGRLAGSYRNKFGFGSLCATGIAPLPLPLLSSSRRNLVT